MRNILLAILLLFISADVSSQSKSTLVKETVKAVSKQVGKKEGKAVAKKETASFIKRGTLGSSKEYLTSKLPFNWAIPKLFPKCLNESSWLHIMGNHGDRTCALKHAGEGFKYSTYFTPEFRDKLTIEVPSIISNKANYFTESWGNLVFRVKYSKPIGFDLEDRAIYDCLVVLDKDAKVVSSYPAHRNYLKKLEKKAAKERLN